MAYDPLALSAASSQMAFPAEEERKKRKEWFDPTWLGLAGTFNPAPFPQFQPPQQQPVQLGNPSGGMPITTGGTAPSGGGFGSFLGGVGQAGQLLSAGKTAATGLKNLYNAIFGGPAAGGLGPLSAAEWSNVVSQLGPISDVSDLMLGGVFPGATGAVGAGGLGTLGLAGAEAAITGTPALAGISPSALAGMTGSELGAAISSGAISGGATAGGGAGTGFLGLGASAGALALPFAAVAAPIAMGIMRGVANQKKTAAQNTAMQQIGAYLDANPQWVPVIQQNMQTITQLGDQAASTPLSFFTGTPLSGTERSLGSMASRFFENYPGLSSAWAAFNAPPAYAGSQQYVPGFEQAMFGGEPSPWSK